MVEDLYKALHVLMGYMPWKGRKGIRRLSGWRCNFGLCNTHFDVLIFLDIEISQ